MVDALIAAVEARGWAAKVDLTEEVVDPTTLVFRDHDDPCGDVAAALGYQPPYALQTEVS
jgi:hypothetical protein